MSDHEELLDIKQAARFLKVSETSLRRWTNSGQLACLRVGRRRERRFRRKDLLAFAQEQPAGAPAPAELPRTEGSHLCGLYASDLSRVNLAVAFLAEGLQAESVSYLAAEPDARDQIVAHLERRRPSIKEDVEAGRLVLSQYASSAAAQLDFWETAFAGAVQAGARSLRLVGDVSGGLGKRLAPPELVEYEQNFETVRRRFGVDALCLYDVRHSSGLDVLDVLKVHKDVFRYPVERLFS
jgi:transcriptional repressor of dcmA and dcmR